VEEEEVVPKVRFWIVIHPVGTTIAVVVVLVVAATNHCYPR
jgi:hypothetical protein